MQSAPPPNALHIAHVQRWQLLSQIAPLSAWLLLSKGETCLSCWGDIQHSRTSIAAPKTLGSHTASPWSLPLALGSFKHELPRMNKPLASEVTSLSQKGQTAVLFSNLLPEVCCEGQGCRLF